MRRIRDVSRRPYREATAALAAIDADVARGGAYMLAAALIPAFDKIIQKRDWALAEIGLCRVALALKAYKHERNACPPTLAALQETLEYALPQDPFSGEDFVYKPQAEGFMLYSLGGDLDDDGGAGPKDEGHSYDDCDIVWTCLR
jgi:hypothetical protein